MPYRIIGPPSVSLADVLGALNRLPAFAGQAPRFVSDIVPWLWVAAVEYGVDPVGVIAQSWKETGGGNFSGAVKPEMCNPCGLKIRTPGFVEGTAGDQTLAHQIFPNWQVGALAQAQHLRAYAGWRLDADVPVQSGRYEYVISAGRRCQTWAELGGKWAPSPSYGEEIETIMRQLGAPEVA